MAITILEQVNSISLSRISQIKSEEMGDVDLVSRGSVTNLTSLTPATWVDTSSWKVFDDIMEACNPFITHDLDEHHREFLNVANVLLNIPRQPVKTPIRHDVTPPHPTPIEQVGLPLHQT
jgi:hypothetical protein